MKANQKLVADITKLKKFIQEIMIGSNNCLH